MLISRLINDAKRSLSTATIQLPAAVAFPVGRCEYSFDPEVT
jgi:hypothetical protein